MNENKEETEIRIDKVTVKTIPDEIMQASTEHDDFMGIQAVAEVSYPIGQDGNRRLEWLTSGGIWGVNVYNEKSYIKTLIEEELADLKSHLERFNINTSSLPMFTIAGPYRDIIAI